MAGVVRVTPAFGGRDRKIAINWKPTSVHSRLDLSGLLLKTQSQNKAITHTFSNEGDKLLVGPKRCHK